MRTVAIDNQDLERTINNVAQSEGKSSAEIVRDALMRHFDVKEEAAVVNLFELGKDLFDGKGNPAVQGECMLDAKRYGQFLDALDAPLKNPETLDKLLSRKTLWEQ